MPRPRPTGTNAADRVTPSPAVPYQRVWAGLDGCRSGWVVAVVVAAPAPGQDPAVPVTVAARSTDDAIRIGPVTMGRYDTFGDAMSCALAREAAAIGVDMPIGMSCDGRRTADREARALLGSRRSTVFPTPVRAVLDATDYAEALVISRQVSGVGLSRQAWNLVPKMAEVDRWVRPTDDDLVFEVHPELAFARIAGEVLPEPKKTAAGRARRLALLVATLGLDPDEAGRLAGVRLGAGVASDDVLDAVAVACSTRALAGGCGVILGDGARDERDLPMRICY